MPYRKNVISGETKKQKKQKKNLEIKAEKAVI